MKQPESIADILARVMPELAKYVQPPKSEDEPPPESGVRRIGGKHD